MRGLRLAAEAVRLQRLLDAEGVPALFVKGASLAQLAYGSQALKSARDIDVLVAPGDAARAFELLKREGYVAVAPAGELSAPQLDILLRLHKDLELIHAEPRAEPGAALAADRQSGAAAPDRAGLADAGGGGAGWLRCAPSATRSCSPTSASTAPRTAGSA